MTRRNTPSSGATSGFTLLEVMLSLAFIAVLSALPFLWTRFSLSTNDLRLTEQVIVHGLRQGQLFARAEMNDASWGVKIGTSSIVLFEGESYDARMSGSDRTMPYPNTVLITGIDEVVYEKFTGEPRVTGEIMVGDANSLHTITLRTHGLLDY